MSGKLLALMLSTCLAACGKAPEKAGPAPAGTATPGAGAGKIAVPGAGLPAGGGDLPALGGGAAISTAPPAGGDDSSFKVEVAAAAPTAAGAAQVVTVKATPGPGYKMNLPYPTYLSLKTVDGVTLAKAELEREDASISEKEVAFKVQATPTKAGTYTVTGEFSFAVCDADSCDPKTQPVSLAVVAN
jgi:hypothetical protein